MQALACFHVLGYYHTPAPNQDAARHSDPPVREMQSRFTSRKESVS